MTAVMFDKNIVYKVKSLEQALQKPPQKLCYMHARFMLYS